MKRPRMLSWVAAVVLLLCLTSASFSFALAAPSGELTIIEFKMTGPESVVLENTSGSPLNLQNYIIEYFNKSSGINFNIPTASQQLPDFTLQPEQAFLLSGDTAATCGAAGVANLNTTLSDSNGYLEVTKVSSSGGNITYWPQDHVSWTSSSSAPSGASIDLLSVPSSANNPDVVWYRQLSDSNWTQYQIDTTPCSLAVISSSTTTNYVDWASGEAPPATVISLASGGDSSASTIPSADIGLKAPQINELLPNPSGTGTDNTDEFIELYNPNNSAFDLSGFVLETGLSTKHKYAFTNGVSLPPKSFTAFYSADTGLTLSNTTSQVTLLDPLGNVVSQADTYSSAKDGMAWALANGKWYWTNQPTPGTANSITQASLVAGSKNTKAVGSAGSVKGAAINSSTSSGNFNGAATPTPVHPWTLAGVGLAALLYAGYEYKADLATNFYRLRRYYAARRAAGK